MGAYSQATITTAGRQLLAQAVAGDGNLTFTEAQTSSYAIPPGTDIAALTSLQDVKQSAAPSAAQISSGTVIQVSASFTNANAGEEITEAYLIETIGLLAQITDGQPVLFAVYQAATPDQMPAYTGTAPSSFQYNMVLTVQEAAQITVTVTPDGTASAADLAALQNEVAQIKQDYIPNAQKAAPGGVSTLDEDGLVPVEQIPLIPIDKGGTGSDNAAQALVNLGAASQADLAALETQFQSDLEAAANELWEQVSDNTSKIATLWDAVFSNITGNPFTAAFTSLAGFNVTAGVYNKAQKRLEC